MIQGIGMFIFSIHGIYLQNRGNSKFFKLKGVPDLWWDVTAISLAFVGNFELGDIPVMEWGYCTGGGGISGKFLSLIGSVEKTQSKGWEHREITENVILVGAWQPWCCTNSKYLKQLNLQAKVSSNVYLLFEFFMNWHHWKYWYILHFCVCYKILISG